MKGERRGTDEVEGAVASFVEAVATLGKLASPRNVQWILRLTARRKVNDQRLAVKAGAVRFDHEEGVWVVTATKPDQAAGRKLQRYFSDAALCSACGCSASGLQEVERCFGFREVARKLYPKTRCRSCAALMQGNKDADQGE